MARAVPYKMFSPIASPPADPRRAPDAPNSTPNATLDPPAQKPPADSRRINYRAAARTLFHIPPQLRWPALTLLLLAAGLFYWTIGKMWLRWINSHSYYSHGPLIFPISVVTAWLIVRSRGLPMDSTPGARRVALALLVGALLVHLASMYALVTFVSGFMLIPVLAAFVLYLGGWPMLGRLWFPIAFLVFMVPLPDLTIWAINFRLKMFAAAASTAIVNGIGVPAYLNGAEIYLGGNKHLTVEDACSGLKSLISLLAFATLFTYACKLRGYKRLLLFASAVPVAVAANIVRIVVLTCVASKWSLTLATPGGWVHDVMGIVVFIIAFCFMFLLEELLDLLPGAKSGRWLGRNGLVPT